MTMTMLEDMKRFTAELDAARTGRKEDWSRIRNASNDLLMDYSAARKNAAAETKKDLMEHHQMIQKECKDIRDQARAKILGFRNERIRMRETELVALYKENIAFKKNVANEIQKIGEDRAKAGMEMHAALSKHRSDMLKELTEMMAESHRARMELRQHLDGMHQDWINVAGRAQPRDSFRSTPSPTRKTSSEDEATLKATEPEAEEDVDLEDSILKILKKAPKGMDLKAVANALGVKWRKTTRPAQELVAKGLVRKEGGMYYPA